jgi:quercetin dioxygenase-like cupin family protein
MRYVRVYADEAGESHFADVQVPLVPVDYAPPAPPLHLSAPTPASAFVFLAAPAGWDGDWHPAPMRQMIFYLSGEVEAEVSDGEVRRFGPGSATLVEDTTGRGHRSRAVAGDVLLAIVQLPNQGSTATEGVS